MGIDTCCRKRGNRDGLKLTYRTRATLLVVDLHQVILQNLVGAFAKSTHYRLQVEARRKRGWIHGFSRI